MPDKDLFKFIQFARASKELYKRNLYKIGFMDYLKEIIYA
jgi:hypothetical protein